MQAARKPVRQIEVMGDRHKRMLPAFAQPKQQVRHFLRRLPVQASRRFVGQHQRRIVDQRPDDRHPLLLTAGQLGRQMAAAVA
ncbi:hypothetical protein HMSSN036_87400 [Paenibacillus macerans]|nr:hypothetical protein HMSSN036_87400 [Paenibacillus macerans]